eukprot:GHVR01005981.1.p1 GENE.GHVR01005981.1~~GHVR01005981.1.p1  ORF type:complete len:114 (-),score=15.80 GHVR01005981.1:2160-2501(-)
MSGFGSFKFSDADSIFKHFFQENGFDQDDDFFGSFMGKKKSGFGSFGSMFGNDDDFFSKGFGGGGFTSFKSSSSVGNGGFGGTSKSVSTVTKKVNGKTVTTKKTTVTNPDGTK